MAHIVVYLQRTPQGVHPASAVALCLARDIASSRGATVIGVCPGDAGAFDRCIARAAGTFGADVMLFCGPRGLENLQDRLVPSHVFAPWTAEGIAAVQGHSTGPAITRWIDNPRLPSSDADAVTGVIAGTMPWHRFDEQLEAEYEGDVDDVPLPPWLVGGLDPSAGQLAFSLRGGDPTGYVCPDGLEPSLEIALQHLGARRVTATEVASAERGTFIWLAPGAGPIPETISQRGPHTRVLVLPGPDGRPDPSWSHADMVLGGAWPEVLERLQPWQAVTY